MAFTLFCLVAGRLWPRVRGATNEVNLDESKGGAHTHCQTHAGFAPTAQRVTSVKIWRKSAGRKLVGIFRGTKFTVATPGTAAGMHCDGHVAGDPYDLVRHRPTGRSVTIWLHTDGTNGSGLCNLLMYLHQWHAHNNLGPGIY